MKFILDDTEINLLPSFSNIAKVEKAAGSLFTLAQKLGEKNTSFTDVVNVYYYMQEGSAFSQEDISKKVQADGLVAHLGNIAEILGEIFSGNKESAKKKLMEAPQV